MADDVGGGGVPTPGRSKTALKAISTLFGENLGLQTIRTWHAQRSVTAYRTLHAVSNVKRVLARIHAM